MGRTKVWTKKAIEEVAEKLDKWAENASHTDFLLSSFCVKNGLWPQRLSEWAEENEVFAEALKKAKARQEQILSEGALVGEFNPGAAIFLLKNVANMSDRVQEEKTGEVEFVIKDFNDKEPAKKKRSTKKKD